MILKLGYHAWKVLWSQIKQSAQLFFDIQLHSTGSNNYIFCLQVAAQNCRRRKLDLISNLSDEIIRARDYKQQLLAEREQLYRLRNEWSNKLLQMEESVLRGLDHDPQEWELGVSTGATGTQHVRARRRATASAAAASRLAKPARAWPGHPTFQNKASRNHFFYPKYSFTRLHIQRRQVLARSLSTVHHHCPLFYYQRRLWAN